MLTQKEQQEVAAIAARWVAQGRIQVRRSEPMASSGAGYQRKLTGPVMTPAAIRQRTRRKAGLV